MNEFMAGEEAAFLRAFEAAQALEDDPESWMRLQRAVESLVTLGALLPEEAEQFEALLTTSRGRILLQEPKP